MAQTTVVKVKVQELTKYGFKANDRYVGLSKNLSEADKTRLVPGAEFEAEYYVADSGKEYLNKIVGQVSTAKPSETTVTKPAFKPKYQKKDDSGLSKEEWAAKDVRISRQGCIQAAVNALAATAGNVEQLFDDAAMLADKMLAYVNQK